MGVFLGPFDPLQLQFNILNVLLRKGVISYDEAKEILLNSLNPSLSDIEKNKIIDSMLWRS